MKFSVEQDDNVVIFKLKQERLDAIVAPDVKAEFLILCQPSVDAMIIDLSMVTFCDSQGLSALLMAQRQMRDNDAPVLLAGVQPALANLLKITQLDRIFPIFSSVEEAMTDLQTEE